MQYSFFFDNKLHITVTFISQISRTVRLINNIKHWLLEQVLNTTIFLTFTFCQPLETLVHEGYKNTFDVCAFHWFGRGFSWRMSDFNLTNSFATSSFVRWDKIRSIVQPVSSMFIRLPNDNQHAHDPWKIMRGLWMQKFKWWIFYVYV